MPAVMGIHAAFHNLSFPYLVTHHSTGDESSCSVQMKRATITTPIPGRVDSSHKIKSQGEVGIIFCGYCTIPTLERNPPRLERRLLASYTCL